MFHFPSVSTNLLSVHHITNNLNCLLTIFPSHYVFQHLKTCKILSNDKVVHELYIMEGNYGTPSTSYQVSSKSNTILESLYQWDRQLDHRSFGFLTHLDPNLAKKNVKGRTCL